MKDQIIRLLAQKNYVPANVPELLRLLRLPPNRQQELQAALRQLEQSGAVARIKGNRYVMPARGGFDSRPHPHEPRGKRFSPAGRF